jgi:hypothetical protein
MSKAIEKKKPGKVDTLTQPKPKTFSQTINQPRKQHKMFNLPPL